MCLYLDRESIDDFRFRKKLDCGTIHSSGDIFGKKVMSSPRYLNI